MKKKLNRIFACAILLVLAMTLSCEMFTTSLFKGTERDLTETMNSLSTDELLVAIKDTSIKGDPNAAKAALEALGTKDLTNIPAKEAKDIMDIATDAILPMNALMNAVNQIMPQAGEPAPGENPNPGDEPKPEESKDQITQVLTGVISSVPTVDTTAIVNILENDKILKDPDTDIGTVALASTSVIVSAIKNEGITEENVLNEKIESVTNIMKDKPLPKEPTPETIEDYANAVIEAANLQDATNEKALRAAVSAVATMSGRPDFNDYELLPGMKMSDIFSNGNQDNQQVHP